MAKDARAMVHTPGLLIFCPVIEPPDARQGDCAGAHGARLKGHIEVAADKPFAAESFSRRAQRQDLGMSRRIVQLQNPVSRTCQDRLVRPQP